MEAAVHLRHNVGDGEVADHRLLALHQLVVLCRGGRGPGEVILSGRWRWRYGWQENWVRAR